MSSLPYSFEIESRLRAPADRVWEHASSFAGINRELWPFRMTHPQSISRLDPELIPLGRPAFRSWILLFGILPVDYDDFTFVELKPGRGFSEVSRLMSAREWRHRRTIEPLPDGCLLRDEIEYLPRIRLAGPLLSRIYRSAFNRRHKVLRRLFGTS